MRPLLLKLWNDDRGAILSIEFLLIATILTIGLVVGFTALRNAVTTEFEQLADAVLSINQSFSVSGLSGCGAEVEGSQAIVILGQVTPHVSIPPSQPQVISITACP